MITMIPGSWMNEYYGLSADDKPVVNVPNGSVYYEMDTFDMYMFDAKNKKWIQQTSRSESGSGQSQAAGTLEKTLGVSSIHLSIILAIIQCTTFKEGHYGISNQPTPFYTAYC